MCRLLVASKETPEECKPENLPPKIRHEEAPKIINDLRLGVAGGLHVSYSSAEKSKNCNSSFKLSNPPSVGWCAAKDEVNEGLQINADKEVYWRKIATKGRHASYIKSYELQYSNDGNTWITKGTFPGNDDTSSSKVNLIQPPLKARLIRILARQFHTAVQMRFEAYYTEYIYIYIYMCVCVYIYI